MVFYADDLYTASAGVTIYNYWNPYVTKHDTSSFYNWEQDNLPLYDLEERTYYLWEKLGYPLSAVPSMALLVSASVPTNSPLSSNVFTSVSAAIEALPEIIRMPTLIEVALSGNMGELNLNNIKCEDDGALEIINRGFGSILSTSGGEYLELGADDYTHGANKVSALDLVDTITYTSALQFSANVSSLFPSANANGFFRNFFATKTQFDKQSPSHAYAGVSDNKTFRALGAPNELVQASIQGPLTDSTDTTADFSSIDLRTDTLINGADYIDGTDINGWYTANALSKISVSNSDGPIYIRGFIVDGSGTATDVGVHVGNSDGITLEYVGAMRCSEKGFDIHNSKVYLRRGSAACRNYNDTNDTTRYANDTYGYYIVNSDVELVTDAYTVEQDFVMFSDYHDYGLYAVNSHINYESSSVDSTADNIGGALSLLEISFNINNKAGIELHDSKFRVDGLVNACQNEYGVKVYSSEFSPARLVCAGNQKTGVDLNSSVVRLNANKGSVPSVLAAPSQTWNSISSNRYAPYTYIKNGKHIYVDKASNYIVDWPASGALATSIRGGHYLLEHHGVDKSDTTIVSTPSVVVQGGMSVVGMRAFSENPTVPDNTGIEGLLVRVENGGSFRSVGVLNSTGSQTSVNTFSGPRAAKSRKIAAVYADNHSNVDLQGITAILHTGVGVMCNNNSTLNVTPMKDVTNSTYELSSVQVGAASSCASVLEVHSTRACLVADNHSEINLVDLGNYRDTWNVAPINTNDVFTDADYIPTYIDHIASGGVQFYPNGSTAIDQLNLKNAIPLDNANAEYVNDNTYAGGGGAAIDGDLSGIRLIYNAAYNGFSTNASGYTLGGECVKALGGSRVNVKNVNFYTGFNNPDDSYYDASVSPAGCNNLHIWNIADDSKLHASYISVSGTYPSLAGYTGPRSFFSSGTLGLGDDSSAVAYAIPDEFSSPDTSTLSVLDHFGSGVEVSGGILSLELSTLGELRTGLAGQYYGPNSYLNSGPFRLYFSVDPVVKHFGYMDVVNASADETDNKPFQHLSQGYLLSGPVSAIAAASSTYDNVLIFNPDTSTYSTSGYLYPSSVDMDPDPNNIWLDESAADAFANSKNATITYSGRKKFLNIYRSTDTAQGESYNQTTSGLGEGFITSNIFDLRRTF